MKPYDQLNPSTSESSLIRRPVSLEISKKSHRYIREKEEINYGKRGI